MEGVVLETADGSRTDQNLNFDLAAIAARDVEATPDVACR
jgi:hypothetical protein